jgi:acetyltransferase
LRLGYTKILANVKAYAPNATINGLLVQEMIRGGKDVIVGMSRDP